MRRTLLITLAVLLCSFYAVAQDYPKGQLFGGLSLVHIDSEGVQIPGLKIWYPGFEIGPQYNFTKMFGIEADLRANFGTPVKLVRPARSWSFLTGPVVSLRGERFTPFVHALLGFNAIGISNTSITDTDLGMALGGGLDVKLGRHFSARVGQFDYFYTKHDICKVAGMGGAACEAAIPNHQNNFSFATGIVVH